jgi:uncharacterized repeat protein (TIGR03803 family)
MVSRRLLHSIAATVAVLAVLMMQSGTAGATAAAASTKVVFSFPGDDEGEYPATELVFDAAGHLYGSTVLGGDVGTGTVFQLSRSGGQWTQTVLYSFTGGPDGGQPYGGVTVDPQGNVYGTAVIGGSFGACPEDGCGVVYQLTNDNGVWTETVIHAFDGTDGYGPGAGLTLDAHGNLYGMTPTGGEFGLGVIFQLKHRPNGKWKFRVIHAFTGGDDGATGSAGRLLPDGNGNFYGVATVGGANSKGVAFELSPPRHGETSWTLKPIYAFEGQPDAGFPYGALSFSSEGHLYGTTYYDGAFNLGSVYELIPGPRGTWTERVLYSFQGGTDGANSISNVIVGSTGDLYGTTSENGDPSCSCGTIFKLSTTDGQTWTETVMHRFTGSPDGAYAYNGMVANANGRLFGATVHGGGEDEGSIYQFTP